MKAIYNLNTTTLDKKMQTHHRRIVINKQLKKHIHTLHKIFTFLHIVDLWWIAALATAAWATEAKNPFAKQKHHRK